MGEESSILVLAVIAGGALAALMGVGFVFARLYHRATKEMAFVRTGMGGQKVVMDGGAVVLPVFHEVILINMRTLRLEVMRTRGAALITKDRMRVDVTAEFYVRVKPTAEAIADAAQTLGRRTLDPNALKDLVEGKFVDALRAVAAEMSMEELHEKRVDFVVKVQTAVTEDLLKNGLELESVSLTALDQTDREFFNPNNAFDAQGLTKLTEEIEARRKARNDIEQDTEVAIKHKNLAAQKESLEISREEEYARLAQSREIEIRRATQQAEIAKQQADRTQEAQEAQIQAAQKVESAKITSERQIEEQRILKEKEIKERDIERTRAVESAELRKQEALAITDQERQIAVAMKSKEQSEADAQAASARAAAVQAAENVITVEQVARAERQKQIELVEARKVAEREAISQTVAAEAEKSAAVDKAEALKLLAEGRASQSRIEATGDADAEKARAEAAAVRYQAEAEGKRKLNEAENLLAADVIAMRVKLALINNLDSIVRESVKPLEQIEGIKILQLDGLANAAGGGGGSAGSSGAGGGNLAEQAVNAALKYRGQAPLLDALMAEVGLDAGSLDGLTGPVMGGLGPAAMTAAADDDGDDAGAFGSVVPPAPPQR